MSRRFILHAGFHKTASTTLQHFLKTNSEVLSQQFSIWVSDFIRPASNKASKFSRTRSNEYLELLADTFKAYLHEEAVSHNLDIVCSHEDFSGQLLGRHSVKDDYNTIFHTLPVIIKTIEDSQLFSEIIVYFSTRSHDNWLESLYWHLVQGFLFQMSLDEFKAKYASIPELETTVQELAVRHPNVTIVSASLDDNLSQPFGPSTPFIDLINPSDDIRSRLQSVGPRRVRLPLEVSLKLLELNREQGLSNLERKKRKLKLIDHFSQENPH